MLKTVRISIFLAVLFLFLPQFSEAFTITKAGNSTGLIGWWTFDGKDMIPNVRDVSGQGYHANLGGQVSTSSLSGKFGQALKFDGSDDRATTQSIALPGNSFSYSFWLNVNSASGGVAEWGSRTCGFNEAALKCTVDGDVTGSASTGDFTSYLNGWHHIAYTSTSNSQILYIDGVQISTASETLDTSSSGVILGNKSSLTNAMSGMLDDFRIYNRVITANEAKSLYNMGAGTKRSSSVVANSRDLVAWWTFDGKNMTSNVADSSGNNYTGRIKGNTSTTTRPGISGQALHFDGNTVVQAPNIPATQGIAAITISVWAKSSGVDNSGNPSIVSMQANGQLHSWGVGYIPISIAHTCFIGSGASYAIGSGPPIQTNDTAWHHIVCTYDGSTIRVYVDTVSGTPAAISGPINASSDPVCIGGFSDGSNCYTSSASGADPWKGAIDDVRVYTRVLSNSEILTLYKEGVGTKLGVITAPKTSNCASGLSCGLVGYWTFDGKNMISNVGDSSGNARNGFLVGQPATTTTFGKVGQALVFDGVNDAVLLPTSIYNSLSQGTEVTLAGWFKGTQIQSMIRIQSTGADYIVLGWYSQALVSTDGSTISGVAINGTDDDKWHHVAMTWKKNTTNGFRTYVDGVVSAQRDSSNVNLPDLITGATFNPSIGAYANAGGEFMRGAVDDVRVYTRALSAEEIFQLYKLGK